MDEKKMVNIVIDDRPVAVPEGSVVLDAAKKLGIYIPTLCHIESLPLQAACRVCIAEMSVEKRGRTYSWIDATCAYPVEEGLTVKTDSPKVCRERKLILELLLSRAPNAPLIQKMAREFGIEKSRFETLDKGASNCILCGLCVRSCSHSMGIGGIGMAYRGIHKKIVTPYAYTQEVCIGCSACASVCPTDEITAVVKGPNMHLEKWETWHEMSECSVCGKPFAPKVHLKAIRGKVGPKMGGDVMDKCPECRRKVKIQTR